MLNIFYAILVESFIVGLKLNETNKIWLYWRAGKSLHFNIKPDTIWGMVRQTYKNWSFLVQTGLFNVGDSQKPHFSKKANTPRTYMHPTPTKKKINHLMINCYPWQKEIT